MVYSGPKPFYPARFFHRLSRYPVRHCKNCGAQLTPKLRSSHSAREGIALETMTQFIGRSFCDYGCRNSFANRTATERRAVEAGSRPKRAVVGADQTLQSTLADRILEGLREFRGLPLTHYDLFQNYHSSRIRSADISDALQSLLAGRLIGSKPDPDKANGLVYFALGFAEQAAA